MPDADDGPGHFRALDVDQVQEIPRMVEPAGWSGVLISIQQLHIIRSKHTVVAQDIFINHTALALVRDIGHPDAADAKAVGLGPSMDFLPQRLVEFLARGC
jgi:hypothetical protein